MREQTGNRALRSGLNAYATAEDFINVFHEDMNGLYHLSFLLTGNHEQAEKCFVAGIEDCVKENHVFREWARSWARRIIVENAIRELKPQPSFRGTTNVASVFSQCERSSDPDGQFDVDMVLGLGDFERFVFVMSVLERYSHHECALLLGCSVWEVRQARFQAFEQLARSSQAVSYTP